MFRHVYMPILLFALVVSSGVYGVEPQTFAFSYYGQLRQNASAVSGTRNMQFRLYDAPIDGSPIGAAILRNAVVVTDGTFSVDLEFPGAFGVEQRWLEIIVEGEILAPRQRVNSVPVAQYALQGAQGPAGANGKVINVTYYINSTRTSLTGGPSYVLASFPVNKLSPTSFLIADGTLSVARTLLSHAQQGWRLGSGDEFLAQTMNYGADGWGKVITSKAVIAGHTTTGTQTMVFRYFNANTLSSRPFEIYNPNNIDDSRLVQSSSVYVVYEVEP